MIIEAEVASAATRQQGTPTSMALGFSFVFVFVGGRVALGARARIGILRSRAIARNAPSTPGSGFDAVLAEGIRGVVEDEAGPGSRAHHEAGIWWSGDR